MKNRFLTYLFAILAVAVSAGCVHCMAGTPDDGLHTITVLETTDTHGAYFDATYDGGWNKSSFSRVSSYVKGLRSSGLDVVLVDNGDNLQGDMASIYYNYVAVGEEHVFSRIADFIGYDAIVVGNHDIEPGHPVYDRLNRSSRIPYLAANAVHSSGADAGKPYFKPYTMVERGGFRIAIIGMTNANIKSWLKAEVWEGIDFLRISSVAQKWVDEVKEKEHPDIVIVSVHSGTRTFDGSMEPDVENEALFLANTLNGVDIVLGGHDHRPFETIVSRSDGTQVSYLNGGTKASSVARCDVNLLVEEGRIMKKSFSNSLVPLSAVEPDQEYISHMEKQYASVLGYANGKIGNLECDLSFDDALDGPSAYISLIHEIQLEASGADISITAPLATSGKISSGVVTRQRLTEMYRFENTLFKIEMTGRQIKDYLEFSYDLWINGSGPSYNYDSMAGIDYRVERNAPRGERITIVSMSSGDKFDLEKTYSVAINSYRMSGGGGHIDKGAGLDPASVKILGSYPEIRELVGAYISKRGTISPKVLTNWSFVN